MKRLLFKYLDEHYFISRIVDGELGRHIIYRKTVNNIIGIESLYRLSITSMLPDIWTIYGLNKKEFKWYLKGWCLSKDRGFLFQRCWEGDNSILSEREEYIALESKLFLRKNMNVLFIPRGHEVSVWNKICNDYIELFKREIADLKKKIAGFKVVRPETDDLDLYVEFEPNYYSLREYNETIKHKEGDILFYQNQIILQRKK